MQAVVNNRVIAEADQNDLISIEGNWYFPPSSIKDEFLKPSERHTVCPWKGEASYYHIDVDGDVIENGAWYYHNPKQGSAAKVGKNFADYVAFSPAIEVSE